MDGNILSAQLKSGEGSLILWNSLPLLTVEIGVNINQNEILLSFDGLRTCELVVTNKICLLTCVSDTGWGGRKFPTVSAV